MKTPKSALFQRTVDYRRGGTPWVAAGISILFALAPFGVLLWALPHTGIGIA
ncbi:hypothetical protein ACFQ1E_11310 [Sphingomonas canadensis]|uniref:ABC transporter permease n=1 Tax=Sphingomonas canadensis TaxID=1219257 RepID=A0ABW3H6B9_9SPHN|nr:hypothetical protein [Sphingomonas canadensis]MCW3836291.1 hypothetical protein [Sphingomonas canadensis]